MADPKREGPVATDDDRDPRHESRIREWSFALFLFGAAALMPPLLMVFDRPALLLGMPLFYVYLFATWAVLIVLVRRIAAHGRRRTGKREG